MHFRRQLAAPGELGLVQGRGVWGPYLSLSLSPARQPVVKASCHSRACYCLPQTRPPHTFLRPFVLAFPSPFKLLHDTRMASHGFTSGFQPFWQWKTTVLHFRCIWPTSTPHDNNTSDPMTACMHLISCCWQSNIWPSQRHLVGAKAHWRSPSLLAEALTPCHPGTPYFPFPYHGSQKTKFNHCRTCSGCAEQPKVSMGRYALRSW